jgi:hypothetical protein
MTNVPIDGEAAAADVGGSAQGLADELEEALIVEMGRFASDLDKPPRPPLADGNVMPVSKNYGAIRAPQNPLLWEGDQA